MFISSCLIVITLNSRVIAKIEKGWSAESALKLVVDGYVMQFEALDDEYLRERAYDIKDLGNRLLNNIQKLVEQEQPSYRNNLS